MTTPDLIVRLRCKLFGHRCVSSSDNLACYGECTRCGTKVGYTLRTYIWRYSMAEEAYKKAWKEHTLPGMKP